MRIGILTLPLNHNYGGIVQAYALKNTLEKLGHTITFIEHIKYPPLLPLRIRYLVYIKRWIFKYLFNKKIIVRYDKYCRDIFITKTRKVLPFINKYIQHDIFSIKDINLSQFYAVIVGSDQVWRPEYAIHIENFFLNFIEDNRIKKIAYAASFGVNSWDFTPQQTTECARLAKQFNLITVREDSGVYLCKKYLGVAAEQVLDPTMLLEMEDYIKIIQTENAPKSEGNLFAYMLDDSTQKQEFVENIATKKGLTAFSIMPQEGQNNITPTYPGVHKWLRSFMDAEFVVTDSFHGCVFSIIFNKPFIAIGNKERGQARFNSLLKLFKLENRLIDISQLNTEPTIKDIDWTKVNSIRQMMKEKSISLIKGSLTQL